MKQTITIPKENKESCPESCFFKQEVGIGLYWRCTYYKKPVGMFESCEECSKDYEKQHKQI